MSRPRRVVLTCARLFGWGVLFALASFIGTTAALYVAVQLAIWRYLSAGGGLW